VAAKLNIGVHLQPKEIDFGKTSWRGMLLWLGELQNQGKVR